MRYTVISILGHVALIASLIGVVHHQHTTQTIIPGAKQIIMASIAPPPKPADKPVPPKGQGIAIKEQKPAPKPHHVTQKAQDKKIDGNQLNHLAILLYKAISAHKQYPELAQELGQHGLTLVSFTASPSGELSQVNIAKSSGYQDLDQAAKNAVITASPVNGLGKYLKHPAAFSLPVRFQ